MGRMVPGTTMPVTGARPVRVRRTEGKTARPGRSRGELLNTTRAAVGGERGAKAAISKVRALFLSPLDRFPPDKHGYQGHAPDWSGGDYGKGLRPGVAEVARIGEHGDGHAHGGGGGHKTGAQCCQHGDWRGAGPQLSATGRY